jgi:hypothetical protein
VAGAQTGSGDMKEYYQVRKHEVGSCHGDGTRVVQCACAHKHRTYAAADRCRGELLAYNRESRTWSARWHNSVIVKIGADGREQFAEADY